MISQIYIESGDTYIMCVVKAAHEIDQIKGAALLIPGFSQSASDIDYFMTNLSNRLNQQGYLTVQIDIFGHGDSYGDLANLSVKIIEENIIAAYTYINSIIREKPIFAISRGFYGNLLGENDRMKIFSKTICINPVITKLNLQNYLRYKSNEMIEISESIKDNPSLEKFFIALGAENTNLRGLRISGDLLYQIVNRINNNQNYLPNSIILSSFNDYNNINIVENWNPKEISIDYISAHCFVRDPDWQFTLINKVIDTIKEQIK